jgi:uncharacterized membrane protein
LPRLDRRRLRLFFVGALCTAACAGARGPNHAAPVPLPVAASASAPVEASCPREPISAAEARALVDRYCVSCHSPGGEAGDDSDFRNDAAIGAHRRNIEAKLSLRAMPPPEAPQPTDAERAALGCWAKR